MTHIVRGERKWLKIIIAKIASHILCVFKYLFMIFTANIIFLAIKKSYWNAANYSCSWNKISKSKVISLEPACKPHFNTTEGNVFFIAPFEPFFDSLKRPASNQKTTRVIRPRISAFPGSFWPLETRGVERYTVQYHLPCLA